MCVCEWGVCVYDIVCVCECEGEEGESVKGEWIGSRGECVKDGGVDFKIGHRSDVRIVVWI